MSQSKVSDFFATRKRNRFNQDDVLLNKQNKTQTLIEPAGCELAKMPSRTTRSRAAAQQKEDVKENNKEQPVKEEEIEKKVRRTRKKDAEELSEKIHSFEEKVKLVRGSNKKTSKTEEEPKPQEEKETSSSVTQQVELTVTTEPTAAPKIKSQESKKLKMNELKQKIQQFNQKLMVAQEKAEKSRQQQQEEKKEQEVSTVAQESQLPAYLKFKHLASKEAESTLNLPKTYSDLLDSFKASDTIVKFISGRQEVCTYLKLKLGIQNITKSKFELTNLGQIKNVYPQAYIYNQEKLFIDFKNDYHLTIAPNFDEIEADPITGTKYFSPHVLLQRLNKFKTNLYEIVKKLHREFLKSQNIEISDEDLKRWHPKFDIENIKPIDPADLPKPPTEQMKTGKDLLSIAKDVYSNRIKEAINGFVSESNAKKTQIEASCKTVELVIVKDDKIVESESKKETTIKSDSSEIKVVEITRTVDDIHKQLKEKKEKGFNDLLERVRAKEKAKEIESMIINSDREKQLSKMNNYMESIRLLMFYYDSEKKSVLEMNKVIQTLVDNLNSKLNFLECKELLENMCKEDMFKNENGQQWLSTVKVRIQFYVKIDKSFELNYLNQKVQKAIEDLKNSN